MPPFAIEGYDVVGVLGRGGMGTVYSAVQLKLKRRVALKVLSAELSHDDAFRARFQREAEIQAGLEHPNVVSVYDSGEVDDRLYIVMQFIEGRDLKGVLGGAALSLPRTLSILEQVASALDAAHAVDLVHRDVKPENILVSGADHAFLADFGLTRTATDTPLTRTGHFLGTAAYAAPEQIRGKQPTALADIYSLTAVLYECLTGQVPFPNPNAFDVLTAHASEPPPRPSVLRDGLPVAMDDVIARGMAKAPQDRPASARALVALAREALLGAAPAPTAEPVEAPPQAPARSSPARARSRRRARVAFAAAGLVALAGGVLSGRDRPAAPRAAGAVASVRSAHLSLSYRDPWKPVAATAPLPGVALDKAVALRDARDELTLTAGTAEVSDPMLLPATLEAGLGQDVAPTDRVRLGGGEALRFGDLAPAGAGRHAVLLALPTTGPVAYVICSAAEALTTAQRSSCAAVARTLKLAGLRATPLLPSARYATRLSASLRDVARARSLALKGVENGDTPRAQARALAAFGKPCRAALSDVRSLGDDAQVRAIHARIAHAMAGTCDAYDAMERAAHAAQRGDYDRARDRARQTTSALERAIAALRDVGYDV